MGGLRGEEGRRARVDERGNVEGDKRPAEERPDGERETEERGRERGEGPGAPPRWWAASPRAGAMRRPPAPPPYDALWEPGAAQ